MTRASPSDWMGRVREPLIEVRWLLDRGYRRAHALRVVGEHHQLDSTELHLLDRLARSSAAARAGREKLLDASALRGAHLVVDGYNVLVGLECFRRGEPLFLADDGVVRDLASERGGHARGVSVETVELLASSLATLRVSRATVILDRQPSGSGRLAAASRAAFAEAGIEATVRTERRADRAVAADGRGAVVCSSDRVILSQAQKAFDLVRYVARDVVLEPV